jgi:Zn-dependent protease/CBS domain-containing protein
MFGKRITLFKLFGLAIRLDASWIVIAALVTWSLAAAVFPHAYPGLSRSTYWWMGAVSALGFFGSIVIHELCHSLVAKHYKLPMHGITLFIFGGVAEMGGEPQSPKVEFLMAIAGPICSILLGFLFFFIAAGIGHASLALLGIAAYLAWINWLLAGFNLIPAFPLDGGRVLRSALWQWKGNFIRATEISSTIGSGFGFALMAFGFYQLFFGHLVTAIWYFLIGSFLRGASRTSYEQALVRSVLAGESVDRFMRPDPVSAPSEISLHQFVDNYLYRYDYKVFPVVEGSGHDLIGCVSTSDVKDIPKEEWDQHRVSEITKPCSPDNTIGADADALEALTKMRDTGEKSLLVTERNRLVAIVSARDVVNFIAAKLNLEGRPTRLIAQQ